MSEGGPKAVLGRCPTCSQLVTLPADGPLLHVECPRCHHQALGAVFIDKETPLPVLMAAEGSAPSEDPGAAFAPGSVSRAARGHDNERTHLLLNVSDIQEEISDGEGSAESAPAAGVAPDEARTHLLLDAADVEELKDAQGKIPAPLGRALSSLPPRAVRFGRAVDDLMHDRWWVAAALLGVVCGVIVPFFDSFVDDPLYTPSGIVSALLFVALGLAYAAAVIAAVDDEHGGWSLRLVVTRAESATRLLIDDIRQFHESPVYLKLLTGARVAVLSGLGGIAAVSLASLVRLLFGLTDPASSLRVVSGITVLLGLAARFQAWRIAPAAPRNAEDLEESVAAAAKQPPILDLAEPLTTSFIGEHSPLHRVLVALTQWRAGRWPDRAGYRAALERHLQRQLPGCRIEREKRLIHGRRDAAADLLIDELVVIQVQHGFRNSSADHAVEQARRTARGWAGKPLILVIFDAPRDAIFSGGATSALLELHERFPMLTARMPAR